MKLKELKEKLKEFPDDADVYYLWDGELRSEVDFVWFSHRGKVVLADKFSNSYTPEDWPAYVPMKAKDIFSIMDFQKYKK